MKDRIILDLCAGTGAWSEPYKLAGYSVRRFDLPDDIRLVKYIGRVHGILAAPPCTVFSYARNRYEPTDQELLAALSVVDACMRIIMVCKPSWWALENPVNKIRRYIGEPIWAFRQFEYGDAAHKNTGLWGNFIPPMLRPSTKTKPSTWKTRVPNANPKDAITPPNFAQAFFEANP